VIIIIILEFFAKELEAITTKYSVISDYSNSLEVAGGASFVSPVVGSGRNGLLKDVQALQRLAADLERRVIQSTTQI
jgi:hypothetical protein